MKYAFTATIGLMVLGTGPAHAQPVDVVAALDSNRDGAIQRAEYAQLAETRFEVRDVNQDGSLTGDERSNHHGQFGPDQTRQESMANAMGVFDVEDTDHDGTIAGDEVDRFRTHMEMGSRPRSAG